MFTDVDGFIGWGKRENEGPVTYHRDCLAGVAAIRYLNFDGLPVHEICLYQDLLA